MGITTLPSRIGLIRPCLESLLGGDRRPDRIVLTLPDALLREAEGYRVPDFLTDRDWHGGLVEIIRPPRDCGPGSKLLGALATIDEPSVLILADDDVRYRRDFVARFAAAQAERPEGALSGWTYRCNGLTIGQGCDGFALWTPQLDGARAFFDRCVAGTRFVYHDDLWISFYLALNDIRVTEFPATEGSWYDQVHQVGALRNLDGELERTTLTRDGLDHLIAAADMPAARRARMQVRRHAGQFVARPARRVAGRLQRLIDNN
ncbi:hypothetical protein FPZ24_02850 [Sphingomonas panacisoli]|uniref:Glycosyltransferase 2-like domain-containing protein n=1 Tax=Sphingomonas panacisoli TaxID=1813879 RepID=A0A5B8LHA4_9SPHN|nr:hypothetical protein [Sphingomonas panacisoli]QDZ06540.1 hypothetical protein FPZ24_02850 [Sphingomonas panacisoli]